MDAKLVPEFFLSEINGTGTMRVWLLFHFVIGLCKRFFFCYYNVNS